jgi:hypothetical protein
MTETDEVEEPQIPATLVLRMTALAVTASALGAYVSRARAQFDAGRSSLNDHALLRAINLACLRGAKSALNVAQMSAPPSIRPPRLSIHDIGFAKFSVLAVKTRHVARQIARQLLDTLLRRACFGQPRCLRP